MKELFNEEDVCNLLTDPQVHIVINDKETEEDGPDFSLWFEQGGDYIPGVDLHTVSKLPSGVYKVAYERDDFHIKPYEINTDEIYSFDNSFTSEIMVEIEKFWSRADIYKKYNIAHKRGILLEGAPGTGKSAIISLLINQLKEKDGIVFLVNTNEDFNLLFNSLNNIIRKIEKERPIVTIIEDIDKLIDERGGNDSMFLDFMDGKNSIQHHVVVMTSNDTSDLSPALLRPSRIDMRYVIEPPTSEIRKEFFKRKGISEELLDEYTDKTEGMSFAELKEVFISTQVLDKPIDKILDQILNPLESCDYLGRSGKKLSL